MTIAHDRFPVLAMASVAAVLPTALVLPDGCQESNWYLLQECVGYLCLLMVWWWLITSLLHMKVLPSTSLVLMV